ncbi:MAG: DUF2059 domain-containing protein [Bacteroidia bacterium]|nr:DUF2059 domain-containing protein [Bacteroidia bacterium]
MKSISCCLFSLILVFSSLAAQEDNFEQKIRLMLELSDTRTTYDFLFQKALFEMKEIQRKQVPDKFWKKHETVILDEAYEDLISIIIPFYKEYFTEEEIDEVNAFLNSEVGQKMKRINPIILEEGSKSVEKWGEEFGEKIINRLYRVQELLFNSPTKEDCSKFREGSFEYFTEIEEDGEQKTIRTEVLRVGNKQIEKANGQSLNMQIVWQSNSQYLLIDPEDTDGSKIIQVSIIEVNNNNFKYLSRFKDGNFYLLGEMTKLNE